MYLVFSRVDELEQGLTFWIWYDAKSCEELTDIKHTRHFANHCHFSLNLITDDSKLGLSVN